MGAIDPPARDSTALILPLILVVGRKAQKLSLHPIDLGEVGRDEMIPQRSPAITWKPRRMKPRAGPPRRDG